MKNHVFLYSLKLENGPQAGDCGPEVSCRRQQINNQETRNACFKQGAYLNTIAGVLPFMLAQKSGQILNLDSVAGHRVDPAAGIYCATKFFVQAMTESMRKDLGVNHGIRANTVSPGVIDTGWAEKVTDPEGRKAAQELNKIAIDPQDVARAVVYALNQPENVTVNDVIISPTRQNW